VNALSVSALVDPVTGGGTAERTVQLARAMTRAGLGVVVLATDAGLTATSAAPDVGGARLELVHCINGRFIVPRISRDALDRLVAEADVVHLCNHWTVLNALVQRAALRAGKPYVVCPAGSLPIFGRSKWLKQAYNALAGRALVARASAWVAITPKETIEFGPYGVDPARVDVVPNGIEPSDFEPGDAAQLRSRLRVGTGRLVLFMGRLNLIKGPDLLLEAFATGAGRRAADTLMYVGPDGGMRAALEQRAQALGIGDRVKFTGWLGGADKVAAYRAADLVVIPSRHEAMSLVALEAGACAKPVLMTDQCGFDQAVASGGAVAVPATSEALGAALNELLLHAPLSEMGAKLRALILRDFTWDASVKRYASIFERVTARQTQ
jgi:glycosyltransferase involved in cell wall biosynthesis